MINQFQEMMRFYENLHAIDVTVLTKEDIQEQKTRLNSLPVLMKEFNDFVNQLDEIDTSIENREQITTLLIDTYVMIEKISLEMAYMSDFCRDANKKYRQKYQQHGDDLNELT